MWTSRRFAFSGFRFTIAAILDGFSRKLLALKVLSRTPRTREVTRLVRQAAAKCGKPRFLITDQGTQFRKLFHEKLAGMKIRHIHSRVRAPYLNGKMERAFRTFKLWWRLAPTGLSPRGIQRQLDRYAHWYNTHRPHSALNGLTPKEAWNDDSLPEPLAFRATDAVKPDIRIRRRCCRGDPALPMLEISVRKAA